METHLLLGIWGIVILSVVIGGMIEENVVIEEDPFMTREQAKEWSSEFFRLSPIGPLSHLDELDDVDTIRNDRGLRQNMRHFDATKINVITPTSYIDKVKIENLEWMLGNIFTYPRSHSTNDTAKEIVKTYIVQSLQVTSGLHTTVQYFKPTQFLEIYDEGELPIGANIIGVIRGNTWGTNDDRPIVVGAHWDTVNFTPGTDDNGSGVAAMLEAARVLSQSSPSCSPKHSIIFVAFDLEETGSQGSLVFIKDYLVKILKSAGMTQLANFQGAFIMDTIMNFNATEGAQIFPTDWSLALPEIYNEVADEKFRGDFLSLIYRKDIDTDLASKFQEHWNQLSDFQFKLKSLPLRLGKDLPELEILSDHLNFLRSDHARFWYMNDTSVVNGTLKAVLITDTGPYRGNMEQCYHTVCDGPEISVYDNPKNIQFLAKATQALTNTLRDLSQCKNSQAPTRSSDFLNRRGTLRSNANFRKSIFDNLARIFNNWYK